MVQGENSIISRDCHLIRWRGKAPFTQFPHKRSVVLSLQQYLLFPLSLIHKLFLKNDNTIKWKISKFNWISIIIISKSFLGLMGRMMLHLRQGYSAVTAMFSIFLVLPDSVAGPGPPICLCCLPAHLYTQTLSQLLSLVLSFSHFFKLWKK